MIETKRLFLRQWQAKDKEPFAKMSRDAEVMRYFPSTLSREQSDTLIDALSRKISDNGWGIFALEERQSGAFVGFTGLNSPSWQAHFTPCTEIGWRLANEHWGKGYASEAALACINLARECLNIPELVSFTSTINKPSIAVMERIGMTRDLTGDFHHPVLKPTDPQSLHVLYRMSL